MRKSGRMYSKFTLRTRNILWLLVLSVFAAICSYVFINYATIQIQIGFKSTIAPVMAVSMAAFAAALTSYVFACNTLREIRQEKKEHQQTIERMQKKYASNMWLIAALATIVIVMGLCSLALLSEQADAVPVKINFNENFLFNDKIVYLFFMMFVFAVAEVLLVIRFSNKIINYDRESGKIALEVKKECERNLNNNVVDTVKFYKDDTLKFYRDFREIEVFVNCIRKNYVSIEELKTIDDDWIILLKLYDDLLKYRNVCKVGDVKEVSSISVDMLDMLKKLRDQLFTKYLKDISLNEINLNGISELKGVHLVTSSLVNASAHNVSFVESELSSVNLSNGDFTLCQFVDSDLSNITATNAQFRGAIFKGQKTKLNDASFIGAQLGGVEFKDVQELTGANFERANVTEIKFHDMYLNSAKFTAAQLFKADFKDSKMEWVDLSHTNLVKTRFNVVDLSYSNLSRAGAVDAKFINVFLYGANLFKINCMDATIYGSFFDKAFSSCSIYKRVQMVDVSYIYATLNQADFTEGNLSAIRFDHSLMNEAIFSLVCGDNISFKNATLIRSVFNSVNLKECDFSFCNMRNTLFCNAFVKDTKFHSSDLRGNTLNGSHFINCDFQESMFDGAVCCDTYFIDSNLENADFRNVRLLHTTRFTNTILDGADFTGTEIYDITDLCKKTCSKPKSYKDVIWDAKRV
ncbi:MAG: pentapeptide repeat-containing protein [Firmicutes bacterium]|nr:pentapeptide repeat-containing protein [Bacillota bacterium]